MSRQTIPPERLYKFRNFSELSVGSIISDTIYLAKPATFNDPLDSQPIVKNDLPVAAVFALYKILLRQRIWRAPRAPSSLLNVGKLGSMASINNLDDEVGRAAISLLNYADACRDPDEAREKSHIRALEQAIHQELLNREDRGIFSLASCPFSVLMWSHYGDQHKGVALGYSVPDTFYSRNTYKLVSMDYGGSRVLSTRIIQNMINGDKEARDEVDRATYQAKAEAWEYENEWRILGPAGQQNSPLELEEIVFGHRCPLHVRYAIYTMLKARSRKIEFSEITMPDSGFQLIKVPFRSDQLETELPRRCLDVYDHFSAVKLPLES